MEGARVGEFRSVTSCRGGIGTRRDKTSGEVRSVPVEIAPRIVVDERVRFGKPVIQGTRVPVDLVLGKLAGGMSVEEVMREYDLSREDVQAALAYAARLCAQEQVRAVPSS